TANGGTSGTYGVGTVFKVTTSGNLTSLAAFKGTNGANPFAGLILGTDGNFYGTTQQGGITNSTYKTGMGTVFRVARDGKVTTLVSFRGTNGASPRAALTQLSDGSLYGTTAQGGITNPSFNLGLGTVFRLLLPPAFTLQPRSQTNYVGAT